MRRGLQPSIRRVVGLSGKIHLGYQSVDAKVDEKMDVRRA